MDEPSSLFVWGISDEEKRLIILTARVCSTKLFTVVINYSSYYAKALVTLSQFHPSLIFAGKVRSLLLLHHTLRIGYILA